MQSEDTLSKYGQSFQTKVISALITDERMMDTLSDVIHKKFFESEANKWIVDEIVSHHKDYNKVPSLDVFKVQVSKLDNQSLQKTIVSQLKEVYSQIGNTDLEYIKNEFAGKGYGDFKLQVAEVVVEALNPIRIKTQELMDDKGELLKILKSGAEKANQVAGKTLSDVYAALGLINNG